MNKADRKILAEAKDKLLSALDSLREAQEAFEQIANDEREKFDNLSEGLQNSDRGQAFSNNADSLDSLASDLNDVIDKVTEAADFEPEEA